MKHSGMRKRERQVQGWELHGLRWLLLSEVVCVCCVRRNIPKALLGVEWKVSVWSPVIPRGRLSRRSKLSHVLSHLPVLLIAVLYYF